MTFRLLPKDVKFFDLFIEDGENLELAAGRLHEMVDRFDRLDERVTEIQALEKRGDEIDREINRRLEDAFITPFDREDIHELTVRLDDVLDGIQAIAETLVIYDVTRPTDESRRLAAIIAEQSVELDRRPARPRRAQGPRAPPEGRPRPRARGGRPLPGRRRAPLPGGRRSARGDQVARPVHGARGDDRCGRGRRRGDRADEPQVKLIRLDAVRRSPPRAGSPNRAGSPRCRARASEWRRRRGSARAAPARPGRRIQGLEGLPTERRRQAPAVAQRRQVTAYELHLAGERALAPRPGPAVRIAEAPAQPEGVQRQRPVGRWRWGGSEGTARWEEDLERSMELPTVDRSPDRITAVWWGPGERTTIGMADTMGPPDQRRLIGRSTLRTGGGRRSRRRARCG